MSTAGKQNLTEPLGMERSGRWAPTASDLLAFSGRPQALLLGQEPLLLLDNWIDVPHVPTVGEQGLAGGEEGRGVTQASAANQVLITELNTLSSWP